MNRRTLGLVVAAALMAPLVGCSTAPKAYPYPENVRSNFYHTCLATSGGRASYCRCALDYLENNVPLADLAADEKDMAKGYHAANMYLAADACQ